MALSNVARVSVLACFGAIVVAASPAAARQESLPPASEIIDRYQQAIGGRDALLRQPSSRSTGRVEIPAAGFTGTLEIVYGEPDRMLMVMNIAGAGEIRTVFDGSVGWITNPMTGPMLLDGDLLEQTRADADVRTKLREGPNIEALETVERTERNGEACHRVRVTWTSGRETFDCYSIETGLLIATEGVQESPFGSAEVTIVIGDYVEFDGVRVPTRVVHRTMGLEQIMILDSVQHGPADPSIFEPPAEIQALIRASAPQAP